MSSCHYTAITVSEGHHLRKAGVNFEEDFDLGVALHFGFHFWPTFFKGNKTGKADIELVPRTSCLR